MNKIESLPGILEFAIDLVRRAGAITLEYFQSARLKVDYKADRSPVTEADRRVEQFMRERIAAAFPDAAILGEEFGERPGHLGHGAKPPRHNWIVDPIDGTKSFIHGVPLFGVMAALEIDGVPAVGAVHFPALGDTLAAARGVGCLLNDNPCRTSSVETLADAAVLASGVDGFAATGRWAALERLVGATRLFRTWGDCYGYLLVATGRAEIMIDPQIAVWDAAPLSPILLEAGGRFTDLNGGEDIRAGHGLATNGILHDQVLAMLTEQT